MVVTVGPGRAPGGQITAPPSKRMAHRAVLCAGPGALTDYKP